MDNLKIPLPAVPALLCNPLSFEVRFCIPFPAAFARDEPKDFTLNTNLDTAFLAIPIDPLAISPNRDVFSALPSICFL